MSEDLICTTCGYVGYPKKITKGSFLIELILWCFFFIPGLIYSIWRISSRYKACPECKSATMIPVNTPVGQKLIEDNDSEKVLKQN